MLSLHVNMSELNHIDSSRIAIFSKFDDVIPGLVVSYIELIVFNRFLGSPNRHVEMFVDSGERLKRIRY